MPEAVRGVAVTLRAVPVLALLVVTIAVPPLPDAVAVAPRADVRTQEPTLVVRGVARREKVIASGEVEPAPEVGEVTVTLQRRVRPGAPWRKVTKVDVDLVEGMFVKAIARPRAVSCRVRGRYDDGTTRVTDAAAFSC